MKKLLLAMLLVLTTTQASLATDIDDIFIPGDDSDSDCNMMSKQQHHYMRFNGVSVNIEKITDRPFTRRANAAYEAALTNPFSCPMICNIELISSRGTNGDFEVIASKAHLGVFVAPRSVSLVKGNIEIKHGRGDDGLQWVESKGHLVSAKNCMFVN